METYFKKQGMEIPDPVTANSLVSNVTELKKIAKSMPGAEEIKSLMSKVNNITTRLNSAEGTMSNATGSMNTLKTNISEMRSNIRDAMNKMSTIHKTL